MWFKFLILILVTFFIVSSCVASPTTIGFTTNTPNNFDVDHRQDVDVMDLSTLDNTGKTISPATLPSPTSTPSITQPNNFDMNHEQDVDVIDHSTPDNTGKTTSRVTLPPPTSTPSITKPTYYLDVKNREAIDDDDHGTFDRPWKTLNYSLKKLQPGDTLLIREGIYQEQRWNTLDETNTGLEDAPISVKAYPGETVLIQNSAPINFFGANWWTIEGLVFESPFRDGHFFQLGLHEGLGQERTIAAEHITIMGCEFRNGVKTILSVNYANDILLKNNYFHHVRPGIPYSENKTEVNAIGIRYVADNIMIRENRFEDIGSDGVHIGAQGYLEGSMIGAVSIIDNDFWVNRPYKGILGNVGENGIDVKWVKGPVLISANNIHGFRPTTSEQDASGSSGAGITIHDNAQNIIIEKNFISDNTRHIIVAQGTGGTAGETSNIVIRNNHLEGAIKEVAYEGVAIVLRYVGTVSIYSNTIISSDDTFYLQVYGGGNVVFKDNIVIGGRADGNIGAINWDVQDNLWQNAIIHPLLEN